MGAHLLADKKLSEEARIGGEIVQQVAVETAAREYADAAGEPFRIAAGVLERLPRRLEQKPVLRIGVISLARLHGEKVSVEKVYTVNDAARANVLRVLHERRGPLDFFRREMADRLDAVTEILPKGIEIRSAGKFSRHADHRNAVRQLGGRGAHGDGDTGRRWRALAARCCWARDWVLSARFVSALVLPSFSASRRTVGNSKRSVIGMSR